MSRWFGAVAVLAAVLGGAPDAGAARAVIEDVRLEAGNAGTTLAIYLSDDSRYRLFTLTAPDRVVLDILTARLSAGVLPLPAGTGIVHQLRAANRPDGSVRLVLDMTAQAEPEGVLRRASGRTGNLLEVRLRTAPPSTASADATAARAAEVSRATPQVEEPTPPAALARPAPAEASAPAPTPVTPAVRRATASPPEARDIIIAVDAGHGGKDPGARGPRGVREKDVTLRIARRLVEIIDAEPGMRGVLIRSRDEFLPLRERMERARAAQADLFVSVHADAVRDRKVKGASVYVLNEKGATDEAARRLAARENAADLIGGVSLRSKDPTLASVLLDLSQSASLSSSIEVADDVLAELARVGTVRKRQVMQAPFMVLKSPDVPSVLIETAYISNPQEEQQLDSDAYRSRLATAIFRGVRTYFYRNPPRGTLVAELSRQRLAGAIEHVISRGETLSAIASRYNISVASIRDANHLTTDRVVVGQVIRIPLARDT